jgi:hypothetical protein
VSNFSSLFCFFPVLLIPKPIFTSGSGVYPTLVSTLNQNTLFSAMFLNPSSSLGMPYLSSDNNTPSKSSSQSGFSLFLLHVANASSNSFLVSPAVKHNNPAS